MAQKIIKTIFQIRRDTTANWLLNKDVIPAAGEPCFEIDTGVFKIGNGTTTYENLPAIAGNGAVEISADGKSIIADEGILKLVGFDAAEVGAQPYKTADGSIEWVVPSTESVDGLQKIVSGLQKDVVGLQEIVTPSGEGAVALDKRVESLEEIVNGTGEGSVAQIISAEVTAQIDNFASKVSGDGVVNTFKELVDYVATHAPEAAQMATDINALKTGKVDAVEGKSLIDDTLIAKLEAIESNAQANKIESIKIGGTLLDIVDKAVDIPVGAGLKGSGEVTVAADGTLGVGEININKIVQTEGDSLVLDGGSSTIS